MLRKIVIVSAIAALGPIAAADSFTDVHDVATTKVESHWLDQATTLDIDRIIDSDSRIVDLDVTSVSPLEFSIVTVENSGEYQVPGWWVYYGQTVDQIPARIDQHDARIIDIEPYVTNAGVRYAFVMVGNTGDTAATWWWYVGQSFGSLLAQESSHNARLTDIESYVVDGTRFWAGIMLLNTGPDASPRWLLSNVSLGDILDLRADVNGVLVDLEDRGGGNYTGLIVPRNGRGWGVWSSTREGLHRIKAVEGSQRFLDVEKFVDQNGATRYLSCLIENHDAPATCAGDTNGDGVVDIDDLLNVLAAFGMCP